MSVQLKQAASLFLARRAATLLAAVCVGLFVAAGPHNIGDCDDGSAPTNKDPEKTCSTYKLNGVKTPCVPDPLNTCVAYSDENCSGFAKWTEIKDVGECVVGYQPDNPRCKTCSTGNLVCAVGFVFRDSYNCGYDLNPICYLSAARTSSDACL